MIHKAIAGIGLFWLLIPVVAGCGGDTSAAKAAKTAQSAPLPVTVTPVRTQQVQRTVELVGTLEASNQVTVAAEIDGQVAAIAADLGDRVNAGQTLARIKDAEFRYAVEQAEGNLSLVLARLGLKTMPSPQFDVNQTSGVVKAKAELDEAQVNFQRMKTLLDQKVISAQEFDAADTRFKTAQAAHQSAHEQARALLADAAVKEAQLAIARKKLKDTTISAPLAGSISKRFVSAGEYVKVAAPLFTIVQDNPLKLTGMIPERFAPQIQAAQTVEARVDSFPDKGFKGKLTRISPASDVASRSFMIEAMIDNTERRLKPGFFAHAAVLTEVDPNALTVPQQALLTFAGVSKVYVIENAVARERVVQTGARVGTNEVEITAGLKPGELVAISGLTRLTDGAAVAVSGPVMPRDKPEGANEPR
ncbi:MAG: efflux RND transporter periplasmic adaptor subunit [Deltaproteobacteria bacterium]|nr:efflux RND transporter periplasmic adaptor subunit [Deltaproteobacteria bacterium]